MSTEQHVPHHVLLGVFNTVALPLRLPTKAEEDSRLIEDGLITLCVQAVAKIRDLSTNEVLPHWDALQKTIESCKVIHDGNLNAPLLLEHFVNLKVNDQLFLHIRESNAGLRIKCVERYVIN